MGFFVWEVLLFLMPCESLVNAWFLSSPTRKIPEHAVSFSLIVPRRQCTSTKFTRRKSVCFVKSDEDISISASSMKVRAMASFLSMAMLESLLASGVPIETILGGGGVMNRTADEDFPNSGVTLPTEKEISTQEHQKEGDRKFALKDEFSPLSTLETGLEKEISTSMHEKEGDRNIALKDGFSPEEPITNPTSSVPIEISSTAIESSGVGDFPAIEDAATTVAEKEVDAKLLSPKMTMGADTPHLIPPVPPAISTAFGRPLLVLREHVPPLQQESESTTMSSVLTDNKVVADEDPYGE